MWTRKQLKERGKKAFLSNFWKCVLAALIFALVAGGGGYSWSSAGNTDGVNAHGYEAQDQTGSIDIDPDSGEFSFSINEDTDDAVTVTAGGQDTDTNIFESDAAKGAVAVAVIIGSVIVLFVVVIIIAVAFVVSAFILNPFELGCKRFFYRNLDEPAKASEIVFAFDHNYKNIVKNLFFRDLYVILWSLLFLIPGIVKAYEYRMIPYLLSENPDMTKEEAFEESKKLMTGNKWKAFVLDLSFIGWELLSILTCGILSIFYVDPYIHSTDAALYEALKYGTEEA